MILKRGVNLSGKLLNLTDKLWEEGISFFIDDAGCQHKYNPHGEAQSIQLRYTLTALLKDLMWAREKV